MGKDTTLARWETTELVLRVSDECRRITSLAAVAMVRIGLILKLLMKPTIDGSPLYFDLGYSSFDSLCRGRWGVSGKTGRRWRQLAETEKFPLVWDAFLSGRISQTHALLLREYLEKHPDEEAVRLEQAERFTAAQLAAMLKPPSESDEEDDERVPYNQSLDPVQLAVFELVVEGMRLRVGRDISVSEAWELASADLAAGLDLPEMNPEHADEYLTVKRQRSRKVEDELADLYRNLDLSNLKEHPLRLIERKLPSDAASLGREADALLVTVHQAEVALGDLFLLLEEHDTPHFRNIGDFGKQCLDISPSKARNLVRRARLLRGQPVVKERLKNARLSLARFDLVMPLIERGCDGPLYATFAEQTELLTLEHWSKTLKKLDDEGLQAWHHRVPGTEVPGPMCPAWVRQTFRNVEEALEGQWTQSVLTKMAALAHFSVLAGVGMLDEIVACQKLAPGTGPRTRVHMALPKLNMLLNCTIKELFEMRLGEEISHPTYLQIASVYWLQRDQGDGLKGLLARLMRRDRYRCTVPGCGRRINLHKHHLILVAQLGPNGEWNLTMVCACCHLRLIHEGRLKVSGQAPDALVWRRAGETYEGTPERSWTLNRRVTGPRPVAEITVTIQDPWVLARLA